MMNNSASLNRWVITKIGLLNYWFYDEEEFEFADGRMILRGSNGSGKSVTMQSFIPLLLDGNKSPERLDPFGKKERKIEDYVLGYGDNIKEENTSYLYMQFMKKESKNLVTVGIGLKGRRNKPLDFWGFIVKDGRNVGKDLLLYQDKANKIPLNKNELKKRIGKGGQVVETVKEYASLVNDSIFGFPSLDEYEEYIKLLLLIRGSKLSSKDSVSPMIITDLMTSSLDSLSDDDLRPISDSIESMNKTNEKLTNFSNTLNALNNIILPYNNYNKYILYKKAKKFLDLQKEASTLLKEENSLKDSLLKDNSSLKELKEKYEALSIEYDTRKDEEIKLKNNNLWQKKEELSLLQNEITKLEKSINEKMSSLNYKNSSYTSSVSSLNKQNELKRTYLSTLNTLMLSLTNIASNAKFDDFLSSANYLAENSLKDISLKSLEESINSYLSFLKNAKYSLEEEKSSMDFYDRLLENLDTLKSKKVALDKEIDSYRATLESAKSEFMESIYSFSNSNKFLILHDTTKKNLFEKVSGYGDSYSFIDIKEEIANEVEIVKTNLTNSLLKLSFMRDEKLNKLNEVTDAIALYESNEAITPLRSENIIKNREVLKQNNIAFIPFYEAVSFKEDVSIASKNIIESALSEAGILDSLIVKEEDLNKVTKLDSALVDKYLVPHEAIFKQDISQVLDISDAVTALGISKEYVDKILRSILICKDDEFSYIEDNGIFKFGIILGKCDNTYVSKFIGAESNENYKKSLTKKLYLDKEALESEIASLNNNIAIVNSDINTLLEEASRIPRAQKLDNAFNCLTKLINKMVTLKEEILNSSKEAQTKYLEIKLLKDKTASMLERDCAESSTSGIHLSTSMNNDLRLNINSENASSDINNNNNSNANENSSNSNIAAHDALNNDMYSHLQLSLTLATSFYDNMLMFKDEFFKYKEAKLKLIIAEKEITNLTNITNEYSLDIESLNKEISSLEYNKSLNTKKISSISETISTDALDIEERINICIEKLNSIPKEKEEIAKKIGILESNITYLNEKIATNKLASLTSSNSLSIAFNILKEELNLFYVLSKESYDVNVENSSSNTISSSNTNNIVINDNVTSSSINISDDMYIKMANDVINSSLDFDKNFKDENYYLQALLIKFRENLDILGDYSPSIAELFNSEDFNISSDIDLSNDAFKEVLFSRPRKDVTFNYNGKRINATTLKHELDANLDEIRELINKQDRDLFIDILTDTVGKKIKNKIISARKWVLNMNELMASLNLSNNLLFSLNWKPKTAETEDELDTSELTNLLGEETSNLGDEEAKKVAMHFRSKIAKAEEMAKESGDTSSFHDFVKSALDYRNWFEFEFMYSKNGISKRPLTNSAFFKFSGGEKALTMYVPLFAAIYAKFRGAKEDSARIIALDEAFAGVDDSNITNMFKILTDLDLDYVINSQILWGDYETIPHISICELIKPNGCNFVTVLRYKWDGKEKSIVNTFN